MRNAVPWRGWSGLRGDQSGLLPLLLIITLLFGAGFMFVGWVFFRGLIILILVGVFIIVMGALVLYANAKGIPIGRTALALFLVLALAGVAVFFAGNWLLAVGEVSVDTETYMVPPIEQLHAKGMYEGDGSDKSGLAYDELLNDDEYVASWSSDFNGQVVTMQGRFSKLAGSLCGTDKTWFKVFINTGYGWKLAKETEKFQTGTTTEGWELTAAPTFTLTDQPHGSGIRVELWAKLAGWVCPNSNSYMFARDEARILGGVGTIGFEKGQYTPGQEACVNVRVKYYTDGEGKGWVVDIYSTAQNKVVVSNHKITQNDDRVCYTVTQADFTVSTGCRNELVATLTNEILDKGTDSATIIDISGLGPKVSNGHYTPRAPQQGDTVTVSWDAQPNPTTQLALQKTIFKYGPGMHTEVELAANVTSYSFVAASAGMWHVEIIAYDAGCRPSEPFKIDITVGEPGDGGGPLPWDLIIALIVWFSAAGVVAYISANQKKYPNFPKKVAWAGLGIGALLIALWWFRVI